MKIFDISLPLSGGLPSWPGDPAFELRTVSSLDNGDDCTLSFLKMCTHFGTHIDAPAHYIAGGATTAAIPLETCIGPADVLDFPETDIITASLLEKAKNGITSERLLLKTRNSSFWSSGQNTFQKNFCALSADAAEWIADHAIRLVGIDYLSIEPYNSTDGAVHKTLLQNNIVILEGLNLSEVSPGNFQLLCLPLSLQNVEGTPCRAVLMESPQKP